MPHAQARAGSMPGEKQGRRGATWGWYTRSKLRDKPERTSERGGDVVGLYCREQKHICGKSYDTAQYMEVDLYMVSARKHKESRRAKKKEASSLAQQTYTASGRSDTMCSW